MAPRSRRTLAMGGAPIRAPSLTRLRVTTQIINGAAHQDILESFYAHPRVHDLRTTDFEVMRTIIKTKIGFTLFPCATVVVTL